MKQFDACGAKVEGWDRLYFHFFPPDSIQRFNSGKWRHLRIRGDDPELTEVSGAIVGALTRVDTHRKSMSVGVYDSDRKPVPSSIQFRGPSNGASPNRFSDRSLNLTRDRRSAYYLGIDASQYGHFIVETLCRAWAWESRPCQVAIIQASPIPGFARAFLGLVPGLAERVETLQLPTQFDQMVVPAASFIMGREAHVRFKMLCEQIAARVVPKTETTTDQPLYLSRAGLEQPSKRLLVGEARLERFLEQQGFLVVRPETLPIPAQIALFNKHRWIVSPNGSACHTRLFSLVANNMIVMSTAAVKGSFILGDLLCQGDTHYANLLSVPELGDDVPEDTAQPVVLDDDRFLTTLKKFGLINSRAAFSEPPPDMETYKHQWISFAQRRRKKQFAKAIDRLSRSLTGAIR